MRFAIFALRLSKVLCLPREVMPGHTKCCTCHAKSSSQNWRSVWCSKMQPLSGNQRPDRQGYQNFHGSFSKKTPRHYSSSWFSNILVIPHKTVAEVSKIDGYRRGAFLWCMYARANPLIDRKVVEIVLFGVIAAVASTTTADCSVVWCSVV